MIEETCVSHEPAALQDLLVFGWETYVIDDPRSWVAPKRQKMRITENGIQNGIQS